MENIIFFKKALREFLNKSGYGEATRIAIYIGKTQQYVSKLGNINNDSKGTIETREKIAESIGYSYENFVKIGESLYNGEILEDILKKIDDKNDKYQQMCIKLKEICPNPNFIDMLYVAIMNTEDRESIIFALRRIANSLETPCPNCYPQPKEGLEIPVGDVVPYGEAPKKNGTE